MTTSLWSVLCMVEVATGFVKWRRCTISLQIKIHFHTRDFSREVLCFGPIWTYYDKIHYNIITWERLNLKSSATHFSANKQKTPKVRITWPFVRKIQRWPEGQPMRRGFHVTTSACHGQLLPVDRPTYVIHMIKHWTGETSTFVINWWRMTSISDQGSLFCIMNGVACCICDISG